MSGDQKLMLYVTPQVLTRLERLAATGFFGSTSNEVAEELLRIALREMSSEVISAVLPWIGP